MTLICLSCVMGLGAAAPLVVVKALSSLNVWAWQVFGPCLFDFCLLQLL